MSTVKTVATILAGVVVLGGGGAYIWSNFSSSSNSEENTTTTTVTTTKSSESTSSTKNSDDSTTSVSESQSQSMVGANQQVGQVQTPAVAPAQAPVTTVILGKSYQLDPATGKMATADQMEVRTKYAELEKQKQAGQSADLPNTALIPNLTPDQPMPITYADIRNASTGWPLKVKGVIEAQLGKPLASATNSEIQVAVSSIAARDGFRDAVKS